MQYYNIEIFKDLDQNFKNQFVEYGKILSFKKKETPFLDEELMKYFYIVLNGRIKSFQINFKNGKEQTLFIYKKGDMFDTIILLDGKPHDVLYEVIDNVKVLQLPMEKVREWLRTNEQFNKHFFPYLASQMRYTEELASDLSLYSTAERLSKLLLQNINPNDTHHYKLLQDLSKTEIAKLLGTVRNVVERHLKKLEKEKKIKNQRKNIYINDIQKLLEDSEQLLLA